MIEYTLSQLPITKSKSKFTKNIIELEQFKCPISKASHLRLSSDSKNALVQIIDTKIGTISSLVQVNFVNRRQNIVDISSRYLNPTHFFEFVDSFNKGKSHICLIGQKKPSNFEASNPNFKPEHFLLMFSFNDFMMQELKDLHQKLNFRVKSNLNVRDDSIFLVSDNGVLYQLTFIWMKIRKKKATAEKANKEIGDEDSPLDESPFNAAITEDRGDQAGIHDDTVEGLYGFYSDEDEF